jgi:hypothetical protein
MEIDSDTFWSHVQQLKPSEISVDFQQDSTRDDKSHGFSSETSYSESTVEGK